MQRSTSAQQQYRTVSQPLSPEPKDTSGADNGSLHRKGSFNFLRRSKSREGSVSAKSTPQRKLSKKERSRKRDQEMLQQQIPSAPPRIPIVPHPPDLQTFGGDSGSPDNLGIMSNRAGGSFQYRLAQKTSQEAMGLDMYRGMSVPPVPPIPSIPGVTSIPTSPYDQYARTESMANRGRASYASSAISTINSPRKIRRRKDPTPFKYVTITSVNP